MATITAKAVTANTVTPAIGQIVLFKSKDKDEMAHGAEELPAIVTHVWTDDVVNLYVFRDNAPPISMRSVSYAEDFAESEHSCAWRWPPTAAPTRDAPTPRR